MPQFSFVCSNILESFKKNEESISISELRWNTEFADVILKAIKEVNHNVNNINLQLDTGIFFFINFNCAYNIFVFLQ